MATVTPSLVVRGAPKDFVDNHVAALGTEGDLHRVSENVNAAEHSLARFAAEADFFCSHLNIPLLKQIWCSEHAPPKLNDFGEKGLRH